VAIDMFANIAKLKTARSFAVVNVPAVFAR